MQNLPIYLYQNTFNVILDLDDTTRGVNSVMYQRDLKIQKGIKNQVRLQFKNSDQKPIRVSNTNTYEFSLVNASSQQQVLKKIITVLDDGVTTSTKGLALLTLLESDTMDLEQDSYKFVIKYYDSADRSYLPTYVNTYYGMTGIAQVVQESLPVLQPNQEITSFLKTYNDFAQVYEHRSGNIYAHPEYNANSGLHTVCLYMTGYRGTVYVQATLSNQPGSVPNAYVTVLTKSYTGFSGADYLNFTGIYTYIRIIHIPSKGPLDSVNDNPAYYGSFDKALYRC